MATKEIKINLVLDGKQVEATLLNSDKLLESVRKSARTTTDTFKDWATVTTGLNQGLELARDVINKIGDSVMKGAKLDVLRANFKGSAEDIELFRKATAGTVTEANLIKLSNQASDLGVSLQDQAKFFALAEDAGDKYGVGVEEGFQKVVMATEGNAKGLKDLGIQKKEYQQMVEDLARAHGEEIDKLDADIQKQIRLEAVLKLSGVTLEDVKNKVQDNADKLEALGVKVEEAETKMGSLISDAVVPLIDDMGSAGTSILGIGSAAVTVIPLLGSLRLALQGVSASALGVVGLVAGIAIAAGIGAGKLIDYLKYDLPEEINEASRIAADKINRTPDWVSSGSRFVPGEGVVTLRQEPVVPTMPPLEPPTGPGEDKKKESEDPFISMMNRRILFGGDFLLQRQVQLELENKLTDEEIENLVRADEIRTEIFEQEKLDNEEEAFQNEVMYSTGAELINQEIELETRKSEIMKQLANTNNLSQLDSLAKEKKIVDKRIEFINAEIAMREEQTAQLIRSGGEQYDAAESLGKQMNRLVNNAIKSIIAEAVITQIAKVLKDTPWPFNLVLAPAAGLVVYALMEAAIPSFETGGMIGGKRHSSGGTMVNAEGGEFIVNREATRSNIEMLEAINSGRSYSAIGGGNNEKIISAILGLGNRLENMNVIAKLSPREFDEGYSDYLLKKAYTG